MHCSFLQHCTLVRGIEFLLAQNYGYVKTVLRNGDLVAVPYIRDKNCLLCWSKSSDDESDDIDFSAVPVSVDTLIEKIIGHTDGPSDWLSGGAVRKGTVVDKLRENVLVHLRKETHLDFVYDIVLRDYTELSFVKNAGRAPLQEIGDVDFFTIGEP